MVYILTIDELRTRTKTIARSLKWEDVEPYVEEAQNMDIKQQIGDATYVQILDFISKVSESPDYTKLLEGGRYTDGCGNPFIFEGLKTTLAYYVLARMIKNINFDVSRFGLNSKIDQYSTMTEAAQRKVMENDARRTADTYFAECIRYLRAFPDTFTAYGCKILRPRNNNRFRVIGD